MVDGVGGSGETRKVAADVPAAAGRQGARKKMRSPGTSNATILPNKKTAIFAQDQVFFVS